MTIGIIIPAAGSGTRFGGLSPKQYAVLSGKPLILYSIQTALSIPDVEAVVVAVSESDDTLPQIINQHSVADERIHLTIGGNTRQESVSRALCHESILSVDIVLVHDAIRPLASRELFVRVAEMAFREGASIPCIEEPDTVKIVRNDFVVSTLNRSEIRRAQTPQGFQRNLLTDAYAKAASTRFEGTDDASLVEATGYPVCCIPGESTNIKITTPADLKLVANLIK